jgi:hypothetical protein
VRHSLHQLADLGLQTSFGGRTHCWLASLTSILAHRPKIVFGVLEVIFRHDPIPAQSFGAGHGQIAFIASLEGLNITRLGADEPGRLISLGGLRSSQHSVGLNFRILARLPGRWSKVRNVFHVAPYAAPAETGRRSFERLGRALSFALGASR